MSATKYVITIALLSLSVSINAQYHYVMRGLRPGLESVFNPDVADNIGQTLVSGYLNGQLKGYSILSRDSIMKSKVISRELQQWATGLDYYQDDLVEFRGKDYSAMIDMYRSDKSPEEARDKWQLLDKQLEVLSKKRLLPTEKDTLSKAEFIQRMVIRRGTTFYGWDKNAEYYMGDMVNHDSRNYEALEDNRNIAPGTNTDIWVHSYGGNPLFGQLRDINRISMLYNYTLSGADTVWIPQFIIAQLEDWERGYPKQVVYFKYDDALRYLNSIPQPVPLAMEPWYAADFTFMIGYKNAAPLMQWFRERIKSEPKTVAKGIINAAKYNSWISASKDSMELENPYSLMQNVSNGELLVSKAVDVFNFIPFLRVTIKDLKKLTKNSNKMLIPSQNFGTAISDRNNFFTPSTDHYLDSLVPAHVAPIVPTVRKTHFFVVRYEAKIADQKLKDVQFGNVWSMVCKLYGEKKIIKRSPQRTYYPDEYKWSKVGKFEVDGYTFVLDDQSMFNSLGGEETNEPLSCDRELRQFHVTYERDFPSTSDAKRKFRPLFVSFGIASEQDPEYVTEMETFDWAEVKSSLGGAFKPFVDAVENGTLSFYRSELVYGLRER